ncbi:hypothetical protein [Streptomyces ficellus]|uniref:hypothetical protein n=1 Tax=Streptomyces ficellus TaxID=1977088 RepID=UPI00142EFC58|nr:hypothetical protein [Streptomyces ficellus]
MTSRKRADCAVTDAPRKSASRHRGARGSTTSATTQTPVTPMTAPVEAADVSHSDTAVATAVRRPANQTPTAPSAANGHHPAAGPVTTSPAPTISTPHTGSHTRRPSRPAAPPLPLVMADVLPHTPA